MSVLKSVFTVGFYTVISRILGFIRDMLMAAFLGAGPISDAFLVAFQLPNLFRRLFAEGAFSAAFIPLITSLRTTNGHDDSVKAAQEIFSFMAAVLLIFTLVFEIWTDRFITFVYPGFTETPYRLRLTIEFARITFPYLMFISLTALFGGVLNSLRKFAASAAAPILLNVSFCVGLLFCRNTFETPGHAASMALLVSGVLQFIFLYVSLYHDGVILTFGIPRLTEAVRDFCRKVLPGLLGAGTSQIMVFIGMMIASLLPTGSVTYLFYADRIVNLPVGLIGIALGTVMLPLLSEFYADGKHESMQHAQNRSIQLGLFFALPSMFALLAISDSLIHILFHRRAFDALAVSCTALALKILACGLPAYILMSVFSSVFYARRDTKTPMVVAVIALVCNISGSFLLYKPLGYVGIAISGVLGSYVYILILGGLLLKQKRLKLSRHTKVVSAKSLFAASLMGGSLYFMTDHLSSYTYSVSLINRLISLTIHVGTGLFVYFGAVYFLRVLSLDELRLLFSKKTL